jgi:hypothetical protein
VFCTAQACEVVDDAILLFRDRGHLTDYGSRLVAERIANRLSVGARATQAQAPRAQPRSSGGV